MSRFVEVRIIGDARPMRRELIRALMKVTPSRLRRLALRLELWRVRYSLWREPPVQNTGKSSE